MSYCNYGYRLLGEIVQRVSGQSLADFADAHIFAPLGMLDTWYIVPATEAHRVVKRPASAPSAEPGSPGLREAPAFVNAIFGGLNSREWQELPSPAGGVYQAGKATFTLAG